MKRLLFLLLALCLIPSLAACHLPEKKDGLHIVTTSFPLYDFAKNVVGEEGTVTLLLTPGEESHSYEPIFKDILDIRSADLFLYIGGQSDAWVERLISDDTDTVFLSFMDKIEPIEIEHDHEGHNEVHYDEHIWTSPKNASLMVKAIADAVQSLLPSQAAVFMQNEAAYKKELSALDAAFEAVARTKTKDYFVVGDRFPFAYLAAAYSLDYRAAFSYCSDDSEVSAATIAYLIEEVRNGDVPIVFATELSTGRVADTICASTSAVRRTLHSLSNLSRSEFDAGESYLSLMTKNVAVLSEALGCS